MSSLTSALDGARFESEGLKKATGMEARRLQQAGRSSSLETCYGEFLEAPTLTRCSLEHPFIAYIYVELHDSRSLNLWV